MIKVLIVDDSALVRQILAQGLSQAPDIQVVGQAADPYQARDLIIKTRPHVLTLDVEMPRMDGLEFLRKLMPQYPLPVIMVSALTQRGKQITLEALEYGAVDFVTKPSADVARGLSRMIGQLVEKIRMAAQTDVSRFRNRRVAAPRQPLTAKYQRALSESTDKIIAIGASTGGTEAIKEVITRFPPNTPGVVIVQHMPAGFTKLYAERMDSLCAMQVKEAEDGDRVLTGKILIAPGGLQMKLERQGGVYRVRCLREPPVGGHCPSVDVLFHSVASDAGPNAVGVILTGMGHDGAEGLKHMRDAGAFTIGQDEESCVVYGMPRSAWERGAVVRQLPLDKIAEAVLEHFTSPREGGGR